MQLPPAAHLSDVKPLLVAAAAAATCAPKPPAVDAARPRGALSASANASANFSSRADRPITANILHDVTGRPPAVVPAVRRAPPASSATRKRAESSWW